MKSKLLKISPFIEELRLRINECSSYKDNLRCFSELASLVSWISNIGTFDTFLFNLELQRQKEEVEISTVLAHLFQEIESMWSKVKVLDFQEEQLTDQAREAKLKLLSMFKSPDRFHALHFYHQMRILIEALATTTYSNQISEYFDLHPTERQPLIKGKAHELFERYSQLESEFERKLETTVWGNWQMLKEVHVLSTKQDAISQLKNWSDVFSKEAYKYYLNRLVNYFFDSSFRQDFEVNIITDHPFSRFAVWEDGFELKDHVLYLGQYGQYNFEPDKSPIGRKVKLDLSEIEKFVLEILKGKDAGVLYRDVINCGISQSSFSSFMRLFNNRADKLFSSGMLTAKLELYSFGKRGSKKLKLLVVPKQILRNSSPQETDH